MITFEKSEGVIPNWMISRWDVKAGKYNVGSIIKRRKPIGEIEYQPQIYYIPWGDLQYYKSLKRAKKETRKALKRLAKSILE